MIYILKTSTACNNNCIYCNNLNKKSDKFKSINNIKKELERVRGQGYDAIKLSCNTEARKDFLEILLTAKKYNFKVILETNGRLFSYAGYFNKIDKYINNYEIYINFIDHVSYNNITETRDGFKQFILGVRNILKNCKNKKKIIAKVVITKLNLPFLPRIVDTVINLGIYQIKFVLPFKLHVDDNIPSLAEAASAIESAKGYIKSEYSKIEILSDISLEHNPYLPKDLDFFNTNNAELKIDIKRHSKKPKFSIIIPTYNRKNSLKFVINNFFRQNYPKSRYEIIIVDDGGKDGTSDMIKKIKTSCNFKYIYWPRKNIAVDKKFKKFAKFYNRVGLARNIGLKHAQGEIIVFNDSDILVSADNLKKHNYYHNKHSNIIVKSFRMLLPGTFKPSNSNYINSINLDKIAIPDRFDRFAKSDNKIYDLSVEGWQKIVTANLSIRKKYIEKIDGFSRDFVFWGFEDIDLGYRLSKQEMKLVWDKRMKVYHQYHPKECHNEQGDLYSFWLNSGIFYRKYMDYEAFILLRRIVLHKLDIINL